MAASNKLMYIRRRKRHNRRRDYSLKLGLSCSLILSFSFFIFILSLAWVYANITEDLPSPQVLSTLLDPSNGKIIQPTKIYDRSGEHLLAELKNPAIKENVYLTSNPVLLNQKFDDLHFQSIPPILLLTTIAASDPGFWDHPGYSWKDIFSQEHPTIAQRLVSDYLLWQEPAGIRKSLREKLLAVQITSLYGKEKILEWFINYADYGNYTLGAASAARVYFNKDAGNITLTEAAILAATAEAPMLNPWDAPSIALERGQKILQAMLAQGWISQDQINQQPKDSFVFAKPNYVSNTIAPDFIDYTLLQLDKLISLRRIKHGGFNIISTLNYELQIQSECTISTKISQLRGMTDPILTSSGEECIAARLLPTLAGEKIAPDQSISAGLIMIDPKTGEILAFTSAGGNQKSNWFPGAYSSNVVWQKHSSGTILTPLIYLAALTRGYTLSSLVWDIPPKDPFTLLKPDNVFHGPMRLRIAMANDYLTPASNILTQIGAENIFSISKQFGLPIDEISNNIASFDALLSLRTSLIDISQLYMVFANQGIQTGWVDSISGNNHTSTDIKPASILFVEDDQGNIWFDGKENTIEKSVITPQLAYLINHTLSDKAATWQTLGHPNVLEVGFQSAAKQGKTRSDDLSAWTIGYTPDLLVSVWTGGDNPSNEISSPDVSSSIWRAIIQYASKTIPPSAWVIPPGISNSIVCDLSGMLPTTNCPATVKEIFLEGTEPTEPDNLYRSLEVNKETGLLATVFTPTDFIVKKIFIDFPTEALNWAIASGYEVPPNSYDIISPQNNSNRNAVITSPKLFSYVSGLVSIKGIAAGDNFQYYRVQVGKGVNPAQWLQIGEDISKPIFNDELIQWDTSNMEGLYAIQLTVVRNDNRIENAFSQVTVDNQPPQISILYPQAEQNISLGNKQVLTLRLDATDNLGIQTVEIYLDDVLLTTLYQTPYAYSWDAKNGSHTLTAKSTDLAGNITETTINFTVSQ